MLLLQAPMTDFTRGYYDVKSSYELGEELKGKDCVVFWKYIQWNHPGIFIEKHIKQSVRAEDTEIEC